MSNNPTQFPVPCSLFWGGVGIGPKYWVKLPQIFRPEKDKKTSKITAKYETVFRYITKYKNKDITLLLKTNITYNIKKAIDIYIIINIYLHNQIIRSLNYANHKRIDYIARVNNG